MASAHYAQPMRHGTPDAGEASPPHLPTSCYSRPESRFRIEPEERPKPKQVEHPIPSMQQAFSESYHEATIAGAVEKPKLRAKDAKGRREELLDQERSEEPPNMLWRFRPGQTCHELRKLMAQVSFGMYLLLNGLANSNAQVVSILQGHIDEIDEFLEVTMEDLELSTNDMTERIDYLKLPMENMEVFATMLEDRAFRMQIVEGNVKIEHILARTTAALAQIEQDLTEGLRSTREFAVYLESQEGLSWQSERSPEVVEIFNAMRGNTEGWLSTFVDLQTRATELNTLMVELENMVALIERTAGKASRRTRFSVQPFTAPDPDRPLSPDSIDDTTPPASPHVKVSAAAPRLTLRFSRMPDERPSGQSYFDLPIRNSLFQANSAPPIPEIPERDPQHTAPQISVHGPNRSSYESGSDSDMESDIDFDEMAAQFEVSRVSIAGTARLDSPTQPLSRQPSPPPAQSPPDSPPLLLQPRTYTPVPPAPLPSPRVVSGARMEHLSLQGPASVKRLSVTKSLGDLRLLAQGSRSPPAAVRAEPRLIQISPPRVRTEASRSPRMTAPPAQRYDRGSGVQSPHTASQSTKRTSLRQRISLKTTPPDSIQVPPPDSVQLQQPVFASPRAFQSYQTFVAPDSAYSSDHSQRQGESSLADPTMATDFSPPVFPGVLPSPQSDQQYFRPVQASPHSPLQQRPHTAGGLHANYLHHQRNAPSAMGMSMLSSVSTMTPGSTSGRTLKKKRSAFGWLKKAFSLDEEERLAYEAKRAQQTPNPYYGARSPKFLDGKRIR